MDSRKYLVAVNGPRDNYEVPAALAESGKLSLLLTDLYAENVPRAFRTRRIAKRQNDIIPGELVSSYPSLFMAHHILKYIMPSTKVHELIDVILGKRVAKTLATKINNYDGLLIYSGYALEAFQKAGTERLKCLFYYHPHNLLAREILAQDAERFTIFSDFETRDVDFRSRTLEDRRNAELQLADYVICASSFTKRSLIRYGISPEKIFVVPYGAGIVNRATQARRNKTFLFVGQGVQRKGLHHLLLAWARAGLSDARLDIVCYQLDARIEVPKMPNVFIHRYLPRERLFEMYGRTAVFVMPSLVEGFGLVFLEALASGCLCIGGENTGLSDLGIQEASLIVPPGEIEQLALALKRSYDMIAQGIDHAKISLAATEHSWGRFRKQMIDTISHIETQLT